MSTSNIHDMMNEQAEWIEGVLPNRDPRKTVLKLQSEVTELIEALLLGGDYHAIMKEIGDCQILLLDIAKLMKVDPVDAFSWALDINRGRSWVVENGSLTHVRG